MPPQPGVFPLPYASTHKARANPTEIHNGATDVSTSYLPPHHTIHHTSSALLAGPSSRPHGANIDDGKKDRRRKEIVGRLGKEMNDRRDDGRQCAESISALHSVAMQLAARPETLPSYTLRLYPLSIERSALLAQLAVEERNSLESAESAYELERERVEEEWKRGRDRIRERLLEGIEERRRRARDEKDGEGTVSEAALDSQSRPHITRKLRNRLGTSPPPTPLASNPNGIPSSAGPTPPGLIANPHSLSVDELPSPFPLPLTATSLPNTTAGNSGGNGGRRRPKGGGFQVQAVGGLGKSGASLTGCKETEVDSDRNKNVVISRIMSAEHLSYMRCKVVDRLNSKQGLQVSFVVRSEVLRVCQRGLPSPLTSQPDVQPGRHFPPLYKSSGDSSSDRLAFFHILERLKTQKRTGWVDNKIPNPESISDHMYRMAVLAMCVSDQTLDISKCVMMAVVHDLAEAQVGDIAPREGIPRAEKQRRESEAMQNFVHEMLHDSPAALKIMSLWKEYEDQGTPEARFVKDLDRFEMAAQALEYERAHDSQTLQTFFDSSIPFIRHTEVREWGADLLREREETLVREEQPHDV